MLWKARFAVHATRAAMEGLLHRAFRQHILVRTPGTMAMLHSPSHRSYSRDKWLRESGISLMNGCLSPIHSPGRPLLQARDNCLHCKLANELMNLRLATMGDLAVFAPNGDNLWTHDLINSQTPMIAEQLAMKPPQDSSGPQPSDKVP